MREPPAFLTITGHLDGYALLFGGVLVDVFPTLDGAVRGRAAAKEARSMLAATLANTTIQRRA